MRLHIASEMDRATLPRHPKHAGDGVLEPLVLIGDAQLHASQPAAFETAQELDPEAAGLDPGRAPP
jgi:hypothetical protein